MIDRGRVNEIAYKEAMRLYEDGLPFHQAVEWAVDLAVNKVQRENLGKAKQGSLGDVVAMAEEAKSIVSPFLWILSIVSFGMAVVNANRMAKMYGSWKAGRAALRRGEPPR